MNTTPGESLGPLVRRLREEKGWTQEQLGEMVGYESGAAISILRIEKQGVVPRPRRLDELAKHLGVQPEVLREAAGREGASDNGDGANDLGARLERLKQEEARRVALERDLARLDDARERANTDFLLRLRTVAERMKGVQAQLPQGEMESEESEASYRIRFARAGVAQALSDSSSGGLGNTTLASAIAAGAHSSALLPGFAGSAMALSGLSAVLRIGQPASRIAVGVGGPVVLAAALISGVVASAMGAKSKLKRAELLAKLEHAEAEITDSNPSVDALEEVVPGATRLFDDIALYGARALSRWESKYGSAELDFRKLEPTEQAGYLALVDVAASQIAVETISLQDLATLRGPDLESALLVAEQVLAEAHTVVAARV